MSVRMTGTQFAEMWNDGEIWNAKKNEDVVIEDELIEVNGREVNPDTINENILEVVVTGGYIEGGKYGGKDFEKVIKKWLKKQSTKSFIVSCDVDKYDSVVLAIKTAGGKIK